MKLVNKHTEKYNCVGLLMTMTMTI